MNIDRSIFKTDKPYVYRRKNVGNYSDLYIRGDPKAPLVPQLEQEEAEGSEASKDSDRAITQMDPLECLGQLATGGRGFGCFST